MENIYILSNKAHLIRNSYFRVFLISKSEGEKILLIFYLHYLRERGGVGTKADRKKKIEHMNERMYNTVNNIKELTKSKSEIAQACFAEEQNIATVWQL